MLLPHCDGASEASAVKSVSNSLVSLAPRDCGSKLLEMARSHFLDEP